MVDLLFVYGTLRSEFDNRYTRLLRAEARLIGPATVLGSIFRISHYPGFRLEPAGEVLGELWQLNSPEKTLAELDEYEGEEYSRVAVEVSKGQKAWITAWIYEYRVQPEESRRIASGDFCAR